MHILENHKENGKAALDSIGFVPRAGGKREPL
jgi:hypothetical protein